MYNNQSSPNMLSCLFQGNQAEIRGGGIRNYNGSSPSFTNCCFVGNSAQDYGGAIGSTVNSHPVMVNCTLASNSAGTNTGGGIFSDATSGPTLRNCILWGNTQGVAGSVESAQIYLSGGTASVTYSCIQDEDPNDALCPFGGAANGNFDDNPLFVAPGAGNCRLLTGSPCVDAGADIPGLATDLDGIHRPLDGNNDGLAKWDMGAYELPAPIITCATNKTVYYGTAWEFDPPAAFDGCTGTNLAVTVLGTVTNGISPQITTRTWLVTNQCNALIATCSQSVTVLDLTPEITTQPQSQNILVGQDGHFWVTATGWAPLSFQWWFNGGAIADATDSRYTRTNAQLADAGSYFVVVTNSLGAATSALAMLTVSSDAALSFDGGDLVIIGDTPALNPSCITVETWVNFGRLVTGSAQFLICKGGDRTSGAYRLLQSGSDIGFSIGHYLNGWGTSRTVPLTTNRWYHIAGTYNGAMMALYLDGTLISSNVVGSIAVGNSSPLYLSFDDVGGCPYYLSGTMDEVRVWNYARAENEIRSTMYHSLAGTEPGLVGYWNFNESFSSQTVLDRSANGSNGQLGSSMAVDADDPTRVIQDIFTPRGTPVSWLREYGLTNDAYEVEELKDTDGDGMTAWQEFWAGTDPTNRNSAFRFESIAANPGAGIILQWQSVSNKFYHLQRSTNLAFGLEFIKSNILATPPLNTETDITASSQGPYFYQIQLRR
jgi:hypothetical protein